MSRFQLSVKQQFDCTYVVEAETAEAVWESLLEGEGDCVHQIPENIISNFEEASPEQVHPNPDGVTL